MIERSLMRERHDNGTFWYSFPRPAAKQRPRAAYLVPEYDEALVGAKDFGPLDWPWTIARASWKDIFYRPVIVDGQRAGTWRRTVTGRSAVMETNLFAALDPAQSRALSAAIARYGKFLGMAMTLSPYPSRAGA